MSAVSPVSSWDDFPVHQAAEFIRHPQTSDRNFYDRYYFNAFDTTGEWMAVFGLGQYPNLGVTDAFVTVRVGDEQHLVRSSKPLGDRADISVGPIRVEVIKPLEKLRVVVEPTEHTVAMDLTWDAFGPAIPEPNQYIRNMERVTFDTQRLAQMGSWSGTLHVNGADLTVDPAATFGSRDRSWGVRPVGEREADGIRQNTHSVGGMWNYFPMRFSDHCLYYICSETPDGHRSLVQAERVWLDGRVEELGRPEHHHHFVPGTRLLEHSTIRFPEAGIEIQCESMVPNFLAVGTGYGLDADWRHGMWQGPELVVQGKVLKVDEIATLGAYAVVDHSARFTYGGKVGYGLYEHSFSGSFPQYGVE
jgi:hypothetical protein